MGLHHCIFVLWPGHVRVLVTLVYPRLQSSQEVAVVALLVSLIHNDLLDVLLHFGVLGVEAQHALDVEIE